MNNTKSKITEPVLPLTITSEDLDGNSTSGLSSKLIGLPWDKLQNLAFDILSAIYNKDNKDNPTFGVPTYTGPQLAFISPSDGKATQSLTDDTYKYIQFDKDQDHGAGVLHAIARYSCRSVINYERFRFLSKNETTWPFLIGPHDDSITMTRALMRAFHLKSRPLTHKYKENGVNYSNTSKAPKGGELLRLKHKAIIRHIEDIEEYKRDPETFLDRRLYLMNDDVILPDEDDFSIFSGIEDESPKKRTHYEKWTKLARELNDLTEETASDWWNTIKVKIEVEYQDHPELAPCPNKLIFLEDLSVIGLAAAMSYRLTLWAKKKSTKELDIAKGKGVKAAVEQYDGQLKGIQAMEYLPSDLKSKALMKRARDQIYGELEQRFLTIVKHQHSPEVKAKLRRASSK